MGNHFVSRYFQAAYYLTMPLSTRSILVGVANLLAIFLVIGAVGWYHENPSQVNTPVVVVSLPVATRDGAQSRRVLKGSKGKGSDCVPLGVNATEGKGKGKGSSKGKGYSAAPVRCRSLLLV